MVGVWVLLMVAAAFLPAIAGTPSGEGSRPAGEAANVTDGVTMPKLIPSCMVQPVYPEQEKKAGIVGMVHLNVEVKADGTVGSIKAQQEVKDHPAFTASAVAAAGKWCFEPAQKDGQAVACTVMIPVRFALEEKKK